MGCNDSTQTSESIGEEGFQPAASHSEATAASHPQGPSEEEASPECPVPSADSASSQVDSTEQMECNDSTQTSEAIGEASHSEATAASPPQGPSEECRQPAAAHSVGSVGGFENPRAQWAELSRKISLKSRPRSKNIRTSPWTPDELAFAKLLLDRGVETSKSAVTRWEEDKQFRWSDVSWRPLTSLVNKMIDLVKPNARPLFDE